MSHGKNQTRDKKTAEIQDALKTCVGYFRLPAISEHKWFRIEGDAAYRAFKKALHSNNAALKKK